MRLFKMTFLFLLATNYLNAAGAKHFGAGVSYGDEKLYYYDRTYREYFNWDAMLKTDFDTNFYAGIGILFIRDDRLVPDKYESELFMRYPIGVELKAPSGEVSYFFEQVYVDDIDVSKDLDDFIMFGMIYYFY